MPDDELAKLYDVAYPNKGAGDFWSGGAATNFGMFATSGNFSASELAAAFQVALWNILFDNDLSLAAGSFQWLGVGQNDVKDAADAMLAAVAGYAPQNTGYKKWTLYKFQQPIPGCTGNCSNLQDYVSAIYDARHRVRWPCSASRSPASA